jgi:hypothetical protein
VIGGGLGLCLGRGLGQAGVGSEFRVGFRRTLLRRAETPRNRFRDALGQPDDRYHDGEGRWNPRVGIHPREIPDATHASAQRAQIVEHAGEGGNHAPGRAFLEQPKQSERVFPGGAWERPAQHQVIADFFPDREQSAQSQPDGRVEPVKHLDGGQQPVQRDIRPFYVGEFMEKQKTNLVGGQPREQAHGQQQSGAPSNQRWPGRRFAGLFDRHLEAHGHDAFALLKQVPDFRVFDGLGGGQRAAQALVIAPDQG